MHVLFIIVKIIGWIEIFAYNAINFDHAIFMFAVKPDALLTIIANLAWIQITNIAFTAFNAFTVI